MQPPGLPSLLQMSYDHKSIESKWQERWETEKIFQVTEDDTKPKFYNVAMYPYPSGELHLGHIRNYTYIDLVTRYKMMQGFNVLHPMGFDAFGLPAEQFAVEHGVHPRKTTERNISNMVRQLKTLGLSYDWSRELATIEPDYYRWTQWIFLQLYHSWFDTEHNAARPISELVEKLESDDPAERMEAISQLDPSGAVAEKIAEVAVSDVSIEVRLEAVRALTDADNYAGASGLIAALSDHVFF